MLFYVLMRWAIPKDLLERTIWMFSIIGMCVYIVNMVTFPHMIFNLGDDGEYDISRGIQRLTLPSLLFIVLCFFYSINKWILTKQKKYILLIFLTYIFIILTVTRQVILFSTLFGVLFVLRKMPWNKKFLVIALSVAFVIYILPHIPIYQALVETSLDQAERNKYDKEDVRLRAWRFYTSEYQTNAATILFGNGIPAKDKSKWADKHWRTVAYEYGGNGCFTVDVGWAGFFWDFGFFATFGLMALMIKAINRKKVPTRQYLTYWCLYIVCTAITSGPILFHHQIINIVTVLYLVYGNEDSGSCNIKLQQLRRHHQLY